MTENFQLAVSYNSLLNYHSLLLRQVFIAQGFTLHHWFWFMSVSYEETWISLHSNYFQWNYIYQICFMKEKNKIGHNFFLIRGIGLYLLSEINLISNISYMAFGLKQIRFSFISLNKIKWLWTKLSYLRPFEIQQRTILVLLLLQNLS